MIPSLSSLIASLWPTDRWTVIVHQDDGGSIAIPVLGRETALAVADEATWHADRPEEWTVEPDDTWCVVRIYRHAVDETA